MNFLDATPLFYYSVFYMVVLDQRLYDAVKAKADTVFDKNSAYKSMYIQRLYKDLGGRYSDSDEDSSKKTLKPLEKWIAEKWENVAKEGQYPVLRPSKRVDSSTPFTISEVDPVDLKKKIKLKQQYKGKKNLPKFLPKQIV
jgi:hypothetical protein